MLFDRLPGRWSGICRTWLEPGKLADESEIEGKIEVVLDGPFLRHTYAGTFQGQPRQGEEMLAFNAVTKRWQSSWLDSFHMRYALMYSEGTQAKADLAKPGFEVLGCYDVGESQPQWSWRTIYALLDDDHLTITAYNVSPAGEEDKAIETVYVRNTDSQRTE